MNAQFDASSVTRTAFLISHAIRRPSISTAIPATCPDPRLASKTFYERVGWYTARCTSVRHATGSDLPDSDLRI